MSIFAEVTDNECVNDRHLRIASTSSSVLSHDRSSQSTATYISPKIDTRCSAVSLRQLSYVFILPSVLAVKVKCYQNLNYLITITVCHDRYSYQVTLISDQ